MELKVYWNVIRRFMWMIVTITLVATLTSAFVSYKVIKPTYQATTSLLVNQRYSAQADQAAIAAGLYNNILANEALVQTYSDIMTSNTLLNQVISDLNLPYKPSVLAKMIAVTSNNQSEVISLAVKGPSIQEATAVANTLASVFQQRVVKLMQVQNVQIVDPATIPQQAIPISPKKGTNIAIAFVLGLMVSVGIAFLIEYLDDKVRTDEQVAEIFGVSVLGVIPYMHAPDEKQGRKVVQADASSVSI